MCERKHDWHVCVRRSNAIVWCFETFSIITAGRNSVEESSRSKWNRDAILKNLKLLFLTGRAVFVRKIWGLFFKLSLLLGHFRQCLGRNSDPLISSLKRVVTCFNIDIITNWFRMMKLVLFAMRLNQLNRNYMKNKKKKRNWRNW